MLADLVSSIREKTGGRFELLGEIGEAETGSVIYLARPPKGRALVALSTQRVGTRPDGSGEYSIDVINELDPAMGAGEACPRCGTAAQGQAPYCKDCGGALVGSSSWATGERSAEEFLSSVRAAAGAAFDVLGYMPVQGRGWVYFAREIASGRIVSLSLYKEIDAESNSGEYSLRVSRAVATMPGKSEGVISPGRTEPPDAGSAPDAARICRTCGSVFSEQTRFCPKDGSVLVAATDKEEEGLVGRLIADRYNVLKRLGDGGFGEVYLAEHVRMGRRCAMKVINPSLRNDSDAASRFSREAANSCRISHSNVASVYDFGETDDGLLYLVMEYVEGETLASLMKAEGTLKPRRTAEIGRQIADALDAAHSLGIVHRDLKPQNVMIVRGRDGSDIVKVVDFGIAKAIEGDWSKNITRTGFVIGTLEYMSPEQLAADTIDGRSDIYSLGCILYEMLTGERTFPGPSGPMVVARRMLEDAPRVRATNPAVPQVLDDIIAMSLARSPSARFQSAEGLRDALAGAVRSTTEERVVLRSDTQTKDPGNARPGRPALAVGHTMAPEAPEGGVPTGSLGRRRLAMGVGAGLGAVAIVALLLATFNRGDFSSTMAEDSPDPPTPGSETPSSSAASTTVSETPTAAQDEEGEIHFAGIPSGASILVNGRAVGSSTVTLAPGQHRVRITARGFVAKDTILTVEAAERLVWTPGLRPVALSDNRTTVAPSPPPETQPPVIENARSVTPSDITPVVSTPIPSAPVETAPALREAQPEPAAARISAADLETVIGAFAAAIESRNGNRVRTVYPGISSNDQRAWSQFFELARNLTVDVSDIRSLSSTGNTAESTFTLRLSYSDASGRKQDTLRYRASIVRGADGLQLSALRAE